MVHGPRLSRSDPETEKATTDLESSQEFPENSATVPNAVPDGGLRAWVQVLLMHIVFMNTWGVANGYGVFQEYYTEHLPESQSTISWIGSVQVCLLFLVGVVAGRITDAGYFRIIFTLGVLLQVLGIFLASLTSKYWQIFLSQALCVGLGNGFAFVPSLTVMASYFKQNRAFAVGLAAAGGGTGGLIYPTLIDKLVNNDSVGGYPWTMRIMGFLMLATYIPCVIWFAPRLPPRRGGQFIDTDAFKEPQFVLFALSQFTSFWGLYFAFFFMGTFARDIIGISQPINLVMVLNGCGIVGRILPNFLADKWAGPLNILIPLNLSAAILIYCWSAIHTETSLYVFAILYGIAAAALQALYPALATTMTPHPDKTGTRVGMIFSFVSIATLTGPFISGQLITRHDGNYLYAQMFAGSSVLVATLLAVALRTCRVGLKLKVKV
ncbi:unnamed protein product [Clonostachys chloroleuca]|uniref:Major facilitator superfamily (MFS) profile domain-containing protein n=1 Tax=Clonostachys chloroleuca TaxID=1926264 RepID=A0AA35QBR3_9HYPO|nr:unnamed protein product [Clonostachys chloroleuca]